MSAGGYAPTPGGLPPTSGTTGGYDLRMQNDTALRIAELLKSFGLGDANSRHSYGGAIMSSLLPKLFESWTPTQGLGLDPKTGAPTGSMDYTGMIDAFKNRMGSQGGLGMIRNDAQNAIGQLGGEQFAGMDDSELIPLISKLTDVASLGYNPIVSKLFGNRMEDSIQDFVGTTGDPNSPTGTNGNRYLPFLKGDPRFSFLTGLR